MKKRTGSKTMVYEAEYGFMVDIVDKADDRCGDPIWDVWLYRKNHGVKMYLFGLLKEHTPALKEALHTVENVLPEYYPDYDKEYCKYDNVDQSYLLDYYYGDDDDEDDDECVCPVCGSTDVELVDEEDDGIECAEDGTATAAIKMAKLVGTDEEIEKAYKIRTDYFDWLHDNFKTESEYSLLLFARWAAQRFDMATFWISIEDYTDWMHTAIMMHIWMSEAKGE